MEGFGFMYVAAGLFLLFGLFGPVDTGRHGERLVDTLGETGARILIVSIGVVVIIIALILRFVV